MSLLIGRLCTLNPRVENNNLFLVQTDIIIKPLPPYVRIIFKCFILVKWIQIHKHWKRLNLIDRKPKQIIKHKGEHGIRIFYVNYFTQFSPILKVRGLNILLNQ
jgi:hypothetical protein